MQIDEVVVGEKYKVRAPNASGYYEVKSIKEISKGKFELIAQGSEPFPRTFKLEQILTKQAPKSKAQRVETANTTVITDFGDGVSLNVEEITNWPDWKRRGRPCKES